jgi:hypothetical protein
MYLDSDTYMSVSTSTASCITAHICGTKGMLLTKIVSLLTENSIQPLQLQSSPSNVVNLRILISSNRYDQCFAISNISEL